MKRTIWLFLLLISWESFSQGFSQINQTPLLYHGSFAGATGNGRLAWVTNLTTYREKGSMYSSFNDQPRINNYLSFDDLWKKTGLGWGVSLLSSNLAQKPSYPVTYNKKMVEYAYKANLYISSKHVFLDNQGKLKYTLSPSIAIGYAMANPHFISERWLEPNGKFYSYYGYGTDYFTDQQPQGNKTFHATAGLLFNSKTGYLGFSFKNTILSWETEEDTIRGGKAAVAIPKTSPVSPNAKYRIVYPSFSFVFAKTIPFDKKGLFTFTPSGCFSLVTFYKRPEFYTKASLLLESYSFNATLGLANVYFGLGTTSSIDAYHSVFGGFKNNHFRAGIAYGWDRDPGDVTGFYELSFSYFFKPRNERRR